MLWLSDKLREVEGTDTRTPSTIIYTATEIFIGL